MGSEPAGRGLWDFRRAEERSFWARLGCSPVPMTTVSFLPPPLLSSGLLAVPRQALLLVAMGFPV